MGTVYHTGNSALGIKNLLINSNGLINQRGYVSGTATTVSNQYTVDRWRVVTSGQNLTFTTTNGVTTFIAPTGGVEQVIENLNVLGGDYVLTINGNATAIVAQSADNVTYTTVTPTDGKYTITGGKYVKVTLSGGTFSLPQFEKGIIPTPFEQRPIGLELSLCHRYYEVFNKSIFFTNAAAGNLRWSARWTTKRVVPTLTYGADHNTNPDTINTTGATGVLNVTGTQAVNISTASAEL